MAVDFMASQVQLLTKYGSFVLLFLVQCQSIDNQLTWYHQSEIQLEQKQGRSYWNEKPFSGKIFAIFSQSQDTAFVQSYDQGKEHGLWKQFYANGQIKEFRYYQNGLKTGELKAYWSNGQLKRRCSFKNDLQEGLCQEWSEEGRLMVQMHYHNGYEEGKQQMWHPNGKIRSNYIIKDGRRYGLLGIKNCANVDP